MLIINCDKGAKFNLYVFLNLCKIRKDIPQLKQASIDAKKQGKSLDITEFLTTHLNYAKAPQQVDINAVKSGNIKLV